MSDFEAGVYWVTHDQPPVLLLDAAAARLAACADIGSHTRRKLLAVPEFSGNRVAFYRYGSQ